MSAPDVRPVGTLPLPDYTETRAFAESLSDDLGPMFGRDVVRLIDALEAVTTERDEALKSRDLWRENGYDLADHHDELRAERDALAAQVATRDEALRALEETFASPHRECSQEDIDPDGMRVGNACIDAEPGDLLFPDDYCERCYVLVTVRAARRSAALPDGPVQPQETKR